MRKESWIITVCGDNVDGVRIGKVIGTKEQVREYLSKMAEVKEYPDRRFRAILDYPKQRLDFVAWPEKEISTTDLSGR